MTSGARILHVLGSPRAEGTPRIIRNWLAVEDAVQAVLCLAARPDELEPELRKRATWFGKTDAIRPGLMKYWAIPRAVAKACAAFQPDVVVSWPTWAASLVAMGSGRRPIVQHCGNPAQQDFWARLLADVRFAPFYLHGGRFACCSDYVRDSFRRRTRLFASRFYTVYNCIDAAEIEAQAAEARRRRPTDDRGPRLLMVATLEDHKDHLTLLSAMRELVTAWPDCRLRLAGAGSLRAKLEGFVRDAGIGPCVEFLGARPDVPALLGQCDIFVLSTTLREGLGVALFEALAAGVPVVATDVPACREALGGGAYGKLVPPADPPALARAISSLWSARAGCYEAIQAGRRFVGTFTPAAMKDEYLRIVK